MNGESKNVFLYIFIMAIILLTAINRKAITNEPQHKTLIEENVQLKREIRLANYHIQQQLKRIDSLENYKLKIDSSITKFEKKDSTLNAQRHENKNVIRNIADTTELVRLFAALNLTPLQN